MRWLMVVLSRLAFEPIDTCLFSGSALPTGAVCATRWSVPTLLSLPDCCCFRRIGLAAASGKSTYRFASHHMAEERV